MTTAERRERLRSIRPPYLVTAGTDRRELSVNVTADASSAAVEMAVQGQWSQRLGRMIAATLRLCLAGPCVSIIIDLHGLRDPHGISMPFWLSAWRKSELLLSSVHLALCLPARTTLDLRLRHAGQQQSIFATMTEARIAGVRRSSQTHRLQSHLAPQPQSVRAARELVAEACQRWHLSQTQDDACLVMSELAANAVEHARTDFVATVSRSTLGLHLAVRDNDVQFPRLWAPTSIEQAGSDERGRGLRLVHASAAAWGATPARGGKVVWATLHSPTLP